MTLEKRGRLLIVSPAFHHYWRPISDAFARLGWTVGSHRYDASDTLVDKARVKLTRELPQRLGRPTLPCDPVVDRRARAAVHAFQPDRVMVIKGDTLGEQFFDALDRPRVPRNLWLYDELRRTAHTTQSLGRFDTIATYSHLDSDALSASGFTASHVPLAFDSSAAFEARQTNELTFVGARYPRRESALTFLAAKGVPVRAYGRDWSGHPLDRARTWRVGVPMVPSGRDLAPPEAQAVMAGSPATINIHGDQDGFTMRTFEACGVGAVQLIDRANVSEFYEPGVELATFSSHDELLELARRAINDDRWGDSLRAAGRRRTLAEHTFVHRARSLEVSWG